MSHQVSIKLLPLRKTLDVASGASLQDILFAHGVEFPCGGRGLCKGCKVRVIHGHIEPSAEDRQRLSPKELDAGWRLACKVRPLKDVTLELAQWDAPILSDSSQFEFTPGDGFGVAVDIGTTTIVGQLVNLKTAQVVSVSTALNEQARHGADVMSRVEFGVTAEGAALLTNLIRTQIESLILELLAGSGNPTLPLNSVVLVGNTVMHHLFCGISVEPMSTYPFEPAHPGLQIFQSSTLGWNLAGNPSVHFLPCLGGFVGSDILAGILATRLHETHELAALIDLGTNGEIVVGNRDRMLCTSTAAGPAFEGARISMGMRAATGAISEVHIQDGALRCHVLGGAQPRGICGSGLVDAAAAALKLGWINPRGRLVVSETLPLAEPVSLTQWDIRELQLAKGAIAAGLTLLLQNWGGERGHLSRIFLAGAFGNYINIESARRIGLLSGPSERILPSGNTALLGAKIALFSPDAHRGAYPDLLGKIQHVSLKEDPAFEEAYVSEMGFPACL